MCVEAHQPQSERIPQGLQSVDDLQIDRETRSAGLRKTNTKLTSNNPWRRNPSCCKSLKKARSSPPTCKCLWKHTSRSPNRNDLRKNGNPWTICKCGDANVVKSAAQDKRQTHEQQSVLAKSQLLQEREVGPLFAPNMQVLVEAHQPQSERLVQAPQLEGDLNRASKGTHVTMRRQSSGTHEQQSGALYSQLSIW